MPVCVYEVGQYQLSHLNHTACITFNLAMQAILHSSLCPLHQTFDTCSKLLPGKCHCGSDLPSDDRSDSAMPVNRVVGSAGNIGLRYLAIILECSARRRPKAIHPGREHFGQRFLPRAQSINHGACSRLISGWHGHAIHPTLALPPTSLSLPSFNIGFLVRKYCCALPLCPL